MPSGRLSTPCMTLKYRFSSTLATSLNMLRRVEIPTRFLTKSMRSTWIPAKSLHRIGLLGGFLMMSRLRVFILPGAVSVYNVIVARSFFETSIPEELFDAAKLDGMSYLGYFVRIVLPLSSAILAVIGLYYFVGHWNDFMTGLIYVTDWDKQPLQNILQQLLLVNQNTTMANVGSLAQQRAADQIKFAIIIVSTVPLFVLYPFLQKYFNKGVMLGAVKG